MEAFYKITIVVMIVFLILILTVIGILMAKKSNVLVYPPVVNQCPDYWTYDGSFCVVPDSPDQINAFPIVKADATKATTPGIKKRTDAITKKDIYTIDFNDSGWQGTCSQKLWANKNNIVWDGVSNYNSCSK